MSATHEIVRFNENAQAFSMLPWAADDELDPFETKVFLRYIRLAGWTNQPVSLGGRHGKELCHMGKNKFLEARQSLHDKGYIVLTKSDRPEAPDIIELTEKAWVENSIRYSTPDASAEVTLRIIRDGKYDEAQLLEILKAITEKIDVSLIGDAGVLDKSQGVPDKGRGCPESETHLYMYMNQDIEDSLSPGVPPTDEEQASPDFDNSEPYIPPGMREMFESKGHLEEDAPADISDRALAAWLRKELGVSKLSKKSTSNLRKKIVRKDEDGSHTHPSPVDLYDSDDSYREFCADRLARFKAMNDGVVNSDQFTLSIRKMHNPEHDTNKQKWPGYLQWRKAYITEIAEPENVYPDGTPIVDIPLEDLPPARFDWEVYDD